MVQKLVHALRHTHPHSPPISMYSLCKLQNFPSLMLQLPIYNMTGDYDPVTHFKASALAF